MNIHELPPDMKSDMSKIREENSYLNKGFEELNKNSRVA